MTGTRDWLDAPVRGWHSGAFGMRQGSISARMNRKPGMRRIVPLIVIIPAVAVLWWMIGKVTSSFDSVTYQGQRVHLGKSYSDYYEYKDDPDRLASGEVAKAQQLVRSAPVQKQFPDRDRMIEAVFSLRFPGYGLLACGEKPQSDGSVLELFGIEVPRSGTMRYLLYRGAGGAFTLIDDFTYSDATRIEALSSKEGRLVYTSAAGATVVVRVPSVQGGETIPNESR